jgi:hypothetical protein
MIWVKGLRFDRQEKCRASSKLFGVFFKDLIKVKRDNSDVFSQRCEKPRPNFSKVVKSQYD